MEERVCSECGSTNLKYSTEGLICQECGLVIESTVMFSDGMLA
ncbi:MAG: TFIIB-type zinc ribbon-containing protein [Candidatus Hodarchaeales archaeon]